MSHQAAQQLAAVVSFVRDSKAKMLLASGSLSLSLPFPTFGIHRPESRRLLLLQSLLPA